MNSAVLERYLLGASGAELPLTTVLEHGLVGLAAERAPEAAPARLVAARAVAKREHERNRALFRDLAGAWAQDGIDTLLFKGFALAEFVYPDASWRPYSDIDAAIDERHLESAHAAALRLGWRCLWRQGQRADAWSHHGDDYHGHELMLLEHPSGLRLDLHRRLLHNNDNRVARYPHQERISAAVWKAAARADLGGVSVLVPSNDDMALVGLVLNRYWSGDRYELRATDFLDLQWLMELAPTQTGGGDTILRARERLRGLRRRAAELGCARTLEAFLRRCDPFEGALRLTPLTARQVARLDLELATEHGHRPLLRLPRDAGELLSLALGAARELPGVYRAQRDLSGSDRATAALTEGAPVDGRHLTHRLWRSRRAAVGAALKLLGRDSTTSEGSDLLALSLGRSLRRAGIDVSVEAGAAGDERTPSEATRPEEPAASTSLTLRLAGRRLPHHD